MRYIKGALRAFIAAGVAWLGFDYGYRTGVEKASEAFRLSPPRGEAQDIDAQYGP